MNTAFFGRRFTALALGTAIAASATLLPVQQAEANDVFAAGVLGAVVGATLFAPPYPYYYAPAYPVYAAPPPPVVVYEEPAYVAPPPPPVAYRSGPRVVTYEDTVGVAYEPWTAGWLDYCRSRYRSFDERSGTFMGYDGVRHFCQVR